jgi:hypothetical protein
MNLHSLLSCGTCCSLISESLVHLRNAAGYAHICSTFMIFLFSHILRHMLYVICSFFATCVLQLQFLNPVVIVAARGINIDV